MSVAAIKEPNRLKAIGSAAALLICEWEEIGEDAAEDILSIDCLCDECFHAHTREGREVISVLGRALVKISEKAAVAHHHLTRRK